MTERPKKTKKKLNLTFEQIWDKFSKNRFIFLHMKSNMQPYILDCDENLIYKPPDGYVEFDNDRRKRGWK